MLFVAENMLFAANYNFIRDREHVVCGKLNFVCGGKHVVCGKLNFVRGRKHVVCGRNFIRGGEHVVCGKLNFARGGEHVVCGRRKLRPWQTKFSFWQRTCCLRQNMFFVANKLHPWRRTCCLRRKKQRIEKKSQEQFLPAAERFRLKIEPADVLFFQDHDSQPGGVSWIIADLLHNCPCAEQRSQACA